MNYLYILFGVGILVCLYFLYKAGKRIIKGIISYRTLGKEEFKKRLKGGFESITPTQKTKGELTGLIISQLGILLGLIINPIYRIGNLWISIELIFIGGFLVNGFGLWGKWQQHNLNKKQDEILKSLEKENGKIK